MSVLLAERSVCKINILINSCPVEHFKHDNIFQTVRVCTRTAIGNKAYAHVGIML
jgi:hypothetical protein